MLKGCFISYFNIIELSEKRRKLPIRFYGTTTSVLDILFILNSVSVLSKYFFSYIFQIKVTLKKLTIVKKINELQ